MKPFLEKHFGKFWLLVVFGFLYLPLAFMVLFSFNSTRQDARFTGFSLRWYEALLNDSKIVDGFFLSLKVAAITGLLSAVLATLRPSCWCATAASWGAPCSAAWSTRRWSCRR